MLQHHGTIAMNMCEQDTAQPAGLVTGKVGATQAPRLAPHITSSMHTACVVAFVPSGTVALACLWRLLITPCYLPGIASLHI
jgi:hypothetical protein